MELGRDPLLRDVTVSGGREVNVWQGQLNAAGVGIEIAEVALDQNPTPARMRQVWLARRAGQARPVIVFTTVGPDQVLVCGPREHRPRSRPSPSASPSGSLRVSSANCRCRRLGERST